MSWSHVIRFIVDEDGPTAVEYAIMLALIIAVSIIAIGSVGSQAEQLFDNNANELDDVLTP